MPYPKRTAVLDDWEPPEIEAPVAEEDVEAGPEQPATPRQYAAPIRVDVPEAPSPARRMRSPERGGAGASPEFRTGGRGSGGALSSLDDLGAAWDAAAERDRKTQEFNRREQDRLQRQEAVQANKRRKQELDAIGAASERDIETGVWQQKVDLDGRKIFTEETSDVRYDEKTGAPYQTKRDKLGAVTRVDPDESKPIDRYDLQPAEDKHIYRQREAAPWEAIDPEEGIKSNDGKVRVASAKALYDREVEAGEARVKELQDKRSELPSLTKEQEATLRAQRDQLASIRDEKPTNPGWVGVGGESVDDREKRDAQTAQRKADLEAIDARLAAHEEHRRLGEDLLVKQKELGDLRAGKVGGFYSRWLEKQKQDLTTAPPEKIAAVGAELAQRSKALDAEAESLSQEEATLESRASAGMSASDVVEYKDAKAGIMARKNQIKATGEQLNAEAVTLHQAARAHDARQIRDEALAKQTRKADFDAMRAADPASAVAADKLQGLESDLEKRAADIQKRHENNPTLRQAAMDALRSEDRQKTGQIYAEHKRELRGQAQAEAEKRAAQRAEAEKLIALEDRASGAADPEAIGIFERSNPAITLATGKVLRAGSRAWAAHNLSTNPPAPEIKQAADNLREDRRRQSEGWASGAGYVKNTDGTIALNPASMKPEWDRGDVADWRTQLDVAEQAGDITPVNRQQMQSSMEANEKVAREVAIDAATQSDPFRKWLAANKPELGDMDKALAENYPAVREAAGQFLDTAPTWPETIRDAVGRFYEGAIQRTGADIATAAGVASNAIFGRLTDQNIDDNFFYQLGQQANYGIQFQQDPRTNDKTYAQLSTALGSTVGFMVPNMAVTKSMQAAGYSAKAIKTVSTLVTAAQGAASQGAQEYQSARAAGLNHGDAILPFVLGGLVGTSEVVPVGRWVERLGAKNASKAWKIIGDMAVETVEESLQEGGQQIGSNAIAKAVYDKNRDLLEGVAGNAALGGGVGAIMSLLVSAATNGRVRRQNSATTPATPPPVEIPGFDPMGGNIAFDDKNTTEVLEAKLQRINEAIPNVADDAKVSALKDAADKISAILADRGPIPLERMAAAQTEIADAEIPGLDPQTAQTEKMAALAAVKLATGQPMESLTSDEQAALKTKTADGRARMDTVRGQAIITDGQLGAMEQHFPAARSLIKIDEATARQRAIEQKGGEPTNEEGQKTAQKAGQEAEVLGEWTARGRDGTTVSIPLSEAANESQAAEKLAIALGEKRKAEGLDPAGELLDLDSVGQKMTGKPAGQPTTETQSQGSSGVEHLTHNQGVAGSSPAPATSQAQSRAQTNADRWAAQPIPPRAKVVSRILQNQGVEPAAAEAFARHWIEQNPGDIKAEDLRQKAIDDFRALGGRFQGEGAAANYQNNPQPYIAAGHSPEEAAKMVADGEAARAADQQAVAQANAAVAESLLNAVDTTGQQAETFPHGTGPAQPIAADGAQAGRAGGSQDGPGRGQLPADAAPAAQQQPPLGADQLQRPAGQGQVSPEAQRGTLARKTGALADLGGVEISFDPSQPSMVEAGDDGTIYLNLNAQQGKEEGPGYVEKSIDEEFKHAFGYIALRRTWEVSGKPGKFGDYVEAQARRTFDDLQARVGKLKRGERLHIERAMVASFNTYWGNHRGPKAPAASFNDVLEALKTGQHDGRPVNRHALVHEFARQVRQMQESGSVTEETLQDVIEAIAAWVRDALHELQAFATALKSKDHALYASDFAKLVRRMEAEERYIFGGQSSLSDEDRAELEGLRQQQQEAAERRKAQAAAQSAQQAKAAEVAAEIPLERRGATGYVLAANKQQIPSAYVLLDDAEVVASHDGQTFAKNPAYPGENTRAYDDPASGEADKVARNAASYLPDLDLSNTPSADSGPPVIARVIREDGTSVYAVVGGNSRRMMRDRLSPEQRAALDRATADAAPGLGFHDSPSPGQGIYRLIGTFDFREAGQREAFQSAVAATNAQETKAQGESREAQIAAATAVPPESLAGLAFHGEPKAAQDWIAAQIAAGTLNANKLDHLTRPGAEAEAQAFVDRVLAASALQMPALESYLFSEQGRAQPGMPQLAEAAIPAMVAMRSKGGDAVADAAARVLANAADYLTNGKVKTLPAALKQAASQLEIGEGAETARILAEAVAARLATNKAGAINAEATGRALSDFFSSIQRGVELLDGEADMFGDVRTVENVIRDAAGAAQPEALRARRSQKTRGQRILFLQRKAESTRNLTPSEAWELEMLERAEGQQFMPFAGEPTFALDREEAAPEAPAAPAENSAQLALFARRSGIPMSEDMQDQVIEFDRHAREAGFAGLNAVPPETIMEWGAWWREGHPRPREEQEALASRPSKPRRAAAVAVLRARSSNEREGGQVLMTSKAGAAGLSALASGTNLPAQAASVNSPTAPILSPTGHQDWAVFTQWDAWKSGGQIKALPIRVLEGKHVGPNRGFGKAHIIAEHQNDVSGDLMQFAHNILLWFDEAYMQPNGRIALLSRRPMALAVVELREDAGGFYSVVTVHPKENPGWKPAGERILGGRKAAFTQSASVPTPTAQGIAGLTPPLEPLVGKDSWAYLRHLSRPVNPALAARRSNATTSDGDLFTFAAQNYVNTVKVAGVTAPDLVEKAARKDLGIAAPAVEQLGLFDSVPAAPAEQNDTPVRPEPSDFDRENHRTGDKRLRERLERIYPQLKAPAPPPRPPESQPELAPVAQSAPAAPPAREIEDFGEKIGGARKDRAQAFAKATDSDIEKLPLSKVWPKSQVDEIEDIPLAALAHALRESIPTKPQNSGKVRRWADQVRMVRTLIDAANERGFEFVMEKLRDRNSGLLSLALKIDLLQAIPREAWGRVGKTRAYPDAFRYEQDAEGKTVFDPNTRAPKQIPSPVFEVVLDDTQTLRGSTPEELTAKLKAAVASQQAAPGKKMQWQVRRNREGTKFYINKEGDPLRRKLKEFDDAKAAFAFIKNNYDDLVAAWEDVKASDNVKETDVRGEENRPRAGQDWRKGQDVTPQMFMDAFRFKGVEFGNWVSDGRNDKERQGMLNAAYDALHDLAAILNIPTQAVSLNGDLGLGFGSRGHGKFAAHYEPDFLVINLTKTRGAGTLAHEWFHALDHYFQRKRNPSGVANGEGDYITQQPEDYYTDGRYRVSASRFKELSTRTGWKGGDWKLVPGVRVEVAQAFADLVRVLDASPMAKRARLNDKGKSGYWGSVIERAARAFENYVIGKMTLGGYHNDYLANVLPPELFSRNPNRYPYLLPEELEPVTAAFDALFGTMKTEQTSKGMALYARRSNTAPPFYSQMQAVLEAKMPNAAPPAQVRAIIDPAKGSGIKPEELKWSGILPALDTLAEEHGGKVPKQALLDFLAADGAVQLEEHRLENTRAFDLAKLNPDEAGIQTLPSGRFRAYATSDRGWTDAEFGDRAQAEAWLRDRMDEGYHTGQQARYERYQLPGGENYREVVLAMPANDTIIKTDAPAPQGWGDTEGGDVGVVVSGRTGRDYTSSHFPNVPNYVAHMRVNEREDAEGKPGLFIEEIQSDRHQAGRERGYRGDDATDDNIRRFFDLKPDAIPDDYREEYLAHPDRAKGIPDAPFRKDWPLQMFKRALRDAVASGNEWIGWTPGEVQADRYDLSKQIDSLKLTPRSAGGWNVQAVKSGEVVIDEDAADDTALAAIIGKDLAKKASEDAEEAGTNDSLTYSGLDLKVGGEGMRGFYDTILPKEIGKYVKQWGAKVEKASLGSASTPSEVYPVPAGWAVATSQGTRAFATEAEAREHAGQTQTGAVIWRVAITDSMREGIETRGQALFARSSRVSETSLQGYFEFTGMPEAKQAPARRAVSAVEKTGAEPYKKPAKDTKRSVEMVAARARQAKAYRALLAGDTKAVAEAIRDGVPLSRLVLAHVSREPQPFNIVGAIINSPQDLAAHALAHRTPFFESLKIAVLDHRNQVIASQIVTVGSLNESLAPQREIVAVVTKARRDNPNSRISGFIITHNHPSGDPSPSSADQRITRFIEEAANVVNVPLIDHIVTNGESYFSFKDHGLIQGGASSVYESNEKRAPQKRPVLPTPEAPKTGNTAEWEVAPASESQLVDTPAKMSLLHQTLQTADPEMVHVLNLNTRFELISVDRHEWQSQPNRKIASTSLGQGTYGVAIILPESRMTDAYLADARTYVRMLQRDFEAVGVHVVDAGGLYEGQFYSWKDHGLMEPPGHYGKDKRAKLLRARTSNRGQTQAEAINEALREVEGRIPLDLVEKYRQQAMQESEGAFQTGRPDLAFGAGDAVTRGVDQARTERAVKVTNDNLNAEAKAMLSKDREGMKRRLLESATDPDLHGALNDIETRAAAILRVELVKESARTGDAQAMKDAQILTWAYRETGTQQARALGLARRDPHKKRADRHRDFLMDALFSPDPKVEQAFRESRPAASKSAAIEALKTKLAQAKEQNNRNEVAALTEALRRERLEYATMQNDANAEWRKKVEAVIDAMGITLDDLFSDRAELRLKGRTYVKESVSGLDDRQRMAVDMMLQGVSPGRIKRMTGLRDEQLQGVLDEVNRQLDHRLDQLGDAALDVDKFDLSALFAPTSGGRTLTPQERAARIAAIKRAMGIAPDLATYEKTHRAFRKRARGKNNVTGGFDINNPDHVLAVADAVNIAKGGRWVDYVREVFINNILSAPVTAIANMTGYGYTIYSMTVQRALEASFAAGRPGQASFDEFSIVFHGIKGRAAKAWDLAVRAWDSERSPFAAEFLNESLSTKNPSLPDSTNFQHFVPGKAGKVIRTPTRFLLAMDTFARTLAATSEVGAMALRLGKASGKSGQALQDFVTAQVNTPGSASWQAAAERAAEWTFTNPLRSEKQGGGLIESKVKWFADMANKRRDTDQGQLGEMVLSMFFPFITTPFRLAQAGLRKTWLGSGFNTARLLADMRFENGKLVTRNFTDGQKLALLADGFAAALLFGLLFSAAEGDDDDEDKMFLVTGSRPSREASKGARELAMRTVPPQTIRIGGRSGVQFNYGRLDPFATMIMTTVDTIRVIKSMREGKPFDDALGSLQGHLVAQIEDKTFMRGMSDLGMLMEGARSLPEWIARQAASVLVPNLIRNPMRALDPVVRDGQTAPTSTENLVYTFLPQPFIAPPAQRDLHGREIRKGGNFLTRALVPGQPEAAKKWTPADRFLINYNRENPNESWNPSRPSADYTDPRTGQKVKMTPRQYSEFLRVRGIFQDRALLGIEALLGHKRPTTDDMEKVRSVMHKATKQAREAMFGPPLDATTGN